MNDDELKMEYADSHDIDDDGQKLLDNSLPGNPKIRMQFVREAARDYGIDGELRVFKKFPEAKKRKYTGEVFKLQLKSSRSFSYIENGKIISFPLKLKAAQLLIEDVQTPTAIIFADVKSKKVYWHPIQLDENARNALVKKMSTPGATDESTITIHTDTSNILTKTSYEPLYKYLQDAKVMLSQRTMLRIANDDTLSAGIEAVNSLEKELLKLDGFTARIRGSNDPTPPGVTFSVGQPDGKIIDYIPSTDFHPDQTPTINMRLKFSTDSNQDQKKLEDFKKAIEEGKGTVTLDDQNIEFIEAKSGNRIIDRHVDGVKVTLSPSIQKQRYMFLINNGIVELSNEAYIWAEDGRIHIESSEDQALLLKTEFNPRVRKESKLNIHVNNRNLMNVNHELSVLDFIKHATEFEISFIDPQSFKRKLFSAETGENKIVNENGYQFVKALSEIEQRTGVAIPYPLPEEITDEQAKEVFWLHRLITGNKVTTNVKTEFTLVNRPPDEPKVGGAASFSQNPPEITLFDKPYLLPNYREVITGVVTKLEQPKGSELTYVLEMDNAEVHLEKTDTSSTDK